MNDLNNDSNPENLIENLPSYNEFDYIGEINNFPHINIGLKNANKNTDTDTDTNNFYRPHPNENTTPSSYPTPRQISQSINNKARQIRLEKRFIQKYYPRPVHRRTHQQRLNNSYKAIKNPVNRIRSEITNEPTYLPNIRKNKARNTVKKGSPLRPSMNNGLGHARSRSRDRGRGRNRR
ncbi:MAG: hypothetical protein EBT86_00435 [Actinobacteria bacterium]|nr:hypothetical protein [Actinomycetota bacterium]NDG26856.1 hypothetical protein [Pseudomonadota bacterium]